MLANPVQNFVCSRVLVCIPLQRQPCMLVQERGRCWWELLLSVQLSLSLKWITEVFNLFSGLCNPVWQQLVFSWRAKATHSPANSCWSPQLFLRTAYDWRQKTRDHLLIVSRAAHLVSSAFMLLTASLLCYWMVTWVFFLLAALQIVEKINITLFTLDST